jgi:hypothetical protein
MSQAADGLVALIVADMPLDVWIQTRTAMAP